MVSIRLQLRLDDATRIGHGKVALLEEVDKTGSISAASRALGMTYRRGWELLDHMNKAFGHPVVTGTTGGLGGAELTPLGRDIISQFRAIEAELTQIATPRLRQIENLLENA